MDCIRKMGRKYQGIFGTPTEPLFNEQTHKLTTEMLEDCLLTLAEENKKRMKCATLNQVEVEDRQDSPKYDTRLNKKNYFKHDIAAEFVFLTCEKFKLPQARFLALEIFDNFMCRHVDSLYAHVHSSASKNKQKEWKAILERVKNQIMLRVVTCCQLASKQTSHYRVVTPPSARRFLEHAGQIYSLESILQSELRVLKTLDYKVFSSSPMVYVETLLEILGHNTCTLEVKMYHSVCLKIMDIFCIQRRSVYSKLFFVATGCHYETSNKDIKSQYSVVESDYVLLSSAVIAASSQAVDPASTSVVIHQLANIVKLPTDDIVDFATILINLILEDNEQ